MINHNYEKLQGSYLFSETAKRAAAFQQAHPDRRLIRLGIGDVTLPLAPAVTDAMHRAVDEMGREKTFRGYAPEQGYEFLRSVIAEKDYRARGCHISADEIFISDGAKCDCGNIQEIFSGDVTVAVCDPVYPVYLDTNVMAGRTGDYSPETGRYGGVTYMPCTLENGFLPRIPEKMPELVYLCFPNNPTGAAISKGELQKWVDAANESGSILLYDAAYEAYITEEGIPHSIYECEGAKTCAIEFRSFSKNAGFTGVRLGFTVVPEELVREGVSLRQLWFRRQGTKYNGTPYIVQRAGEAVYTPDGQRQIRAQIGYYMENAAVIREGLLACGYEASGGVNSPYIWMKTPDGLTSWEFFDRLLNEAGVIGTPGSGFGPSGEGYFRLTAFGNRENTLEAVERIRKM
ncbi:LL-diaminopimelate aminotransferase [Lachnoclostridium sp. An14]|uniref:LL-diaminopimelate aminotransferase n=1 Tax=Lachnoclostridium sp. An14 TaxID=1965562 RepID=UPI000B3A4CD8|nr:LL-diaminopimelate aminotransferase [Lachnoclostridium sp. An14]OUQ21064.1 LL-diaminopimelate aminotransferase [Lachnoclostridium sp. An14]